VIAGLARRAAAAALAAALAGAACGTSSGTSPLLGLEGRDREVLERTYPEGTPRDVIRAREAQPLVFSIHTCDPATRDRDPTLDAALAAFENEFPGVVPRCDRVRLARTGWVTVIGGMAYYQDYVFYDADDRVLVAYRAFIQRTER
jgi:hypothetical protein